MNRFAWVLALVAIASPAAGESLSAEDSKAMDIFADALAKMEENYVQPFDGKVVVDNALAAAAGSLDSHSGYLTKQDLEQLSKRDSDTLGGVGLELGMRDGLITVIAPFDATPAAMAGFRSGDVLLEINGMSMVGRPLDIAVRALRGQVGSKIMVKIARPGVSLPIEQTMTRVSVHVTNTVTFHVDGSYGYIRIAALDEGTDDELRTAIRHLGDVKGYILDLRNNPGGLLDSAVSIAGEFLVKGTVLSLRGRTPDNNKTFEGTGHDLARGKPIVILVNGGTASGAEAIAGALQDNHRVKVIGMPTFGTGSVQTIIPVKGGGALRLTTALMVLPSGRLIQEAGIEPDKLVSGVPRGADRTSYRETMLDGHIPGNVEPGSDAAVLYPAPGRSDDFQLTTAIAILDGTMQ